METQLSGIAPAPKVRDSLGDCEAIRNIQRQIRQIAPTDCTVLIVGETGTGKGLVASYIHRQSQRANRPLIYINCATPPDSGLESGLFAVYQHKSVRIDRIPTPECLLEYNGQTVNVDEISELSPEGQANFLEALEMIENYNSSPENEEKIDLRFIVTSQYDLKDLVRQRKFNKRLFYHLNLFVIKLPPLRERGKDKLTIAAHLVEKYCKKYNKPLLGLTPDAVIALDSHRWPGNYREMRNTIERAVVMADGNVIAADLLILDNEPFDELPEAPDTTNASGPIALPENKTPGADLSLEDYFQHFVLAHQDQMTETELAKKLGISRKSLWERRQRLGIPRRKS